MRMRDYSTQRPLADDVLLLIEVSDTTLSIDRGKKAKLYARAGIADYWIINIPKRCVEIRRDPEGEVYRSVQTLHRGEEAATAGLSGRGLGRHPAVPRMTHQRRVS